MSHKLNHEELKGLISRLRSEYSDLARRFGTKNFDLSAFEYRLARLDFKKSTLEAFIFAEIAFLEDLKDQVEKKIVRKMEIDRAINHVASKLEENWENYPKLDFHPAADGEIRYFYGALARFNEGLLEIPRQLFAGTIESLEMQPLILQVESFSRRNAGEAPRFRELIATYQLRKKEGERDKQRLMREAARSLYRLVEHLEKILHRTDFFEANTVSVDWEKVNAEDKENWMKLEPRVLVQKVIEEALAVIDDFRLTEFARSRKIESR